MQPQKHADQGLLHQRTESAGWTLEQAQDTATRTCLLPCLCTDMHACLPSTVHCRACRHAGPCTLSSPSNLPTRIIPQVVRDMPIMDWVPSDPPQQREHRPALPSTSMAPGLSGVDFVGQLPQQSTGPPPRGCRPWWSPPRHSPLVSREDLGGPSGADWPLPMACSRCRMVTTTSMAAERSWGTWRISSSRPWPRMLGVSWPRHLRRQPSTLSGCGCLGPWVMSCTGLRADSAGSFLFPVFGITVTSSFAAYGQNTIS